MCTEGTVRMGNYNVLIVAGMISKRKVVVVQSNCEKTIIVNVKKKRYLATNAINVYVIWLN